MRGRERLDGYSRRSYRQLLTDPVAMPRNESLDRRHRDPAWHDDLYPPIEMNAQCESPRPDASAQDELRTGRALRLTIEG